MPTNRTFTHLTSTSARSGCDGVQRGSEPWGDPATFVDRLSFNFREPDALALTRLYKALGRLDSGIDVYLDSSIWDTNLDKKIWSQLLNHADSIRILPQVRLEVEPWLQRHQTSRAARALSGNNPAFSVLPLPEQETVEAATLTYYVNLLLMRRRVGDLMEEKLRKSLGRLPTEAEIASETQKSVGTRGLLFVHKSGKKVQADPLATDESLVYETIANGVRTGRPTLLLTRDRDLLEQFYKLCWLLDTHYRAMLIADAFVEQPDLFAQLAPPKISQWGEIFDATNSLLWATPDTRMNDFLPPKPHFVAVECWVLGRTAFERLVFGAETEMADLLNVKGRTYGLVSEGLEGRNAHPWLAPLPIDATLRHSTAIAKDRFIHMSDSSTRLGLFDVMHTVNTKERYTRLRTPWQPYRRPK